MCRVCVVTLVGAGWQAPTITLYTQCTCTCTCILHVLLLYRIQACILRFFNRKGHKVKGTLHGLFSVLHWYNKAIIFQLGQLKTKKVKFKVLNTISFSLIPDVQMVLFPWRFGGALRFAFSFYSFDCSC